MSQFQPPNQWGQQPQQPPTYAPPPQFYPYQEQPQPPKKRPSSKWLWIAAGIIVLLLFACAGASSAYHRAADLSIQATPFTTEQPTVVPYSTPFHVGQVVTVGTWKVSVNSVKTSQGDTIFQPKTGTVYLIIDVTATNTDSKPQILSSAGLFQLKDSTGLAYDERITDLGKPPEGTIQPGDTLRGQILYEVPRAEHHFTFQFQSEFYLGQAATWDITV